MSDTPDKKTPVSSQPFFFSVVLLFSHFFLPLSLPLDLPRPSPRFVNAQPIYFNNHPFFFRMIFFVLLGSVDRSHR